MITSAFNEIIEMHLKQFHFHEWTKNSYTSASLVSKIMKILLIDRIYTADTYFLDSWKGGNVVKL